MTNHLLVDLVFYCKGDNGVWQCNEVPNSHKLNLPPVGFEPRTSWSKVGCANHLATWTLISIGGKQWSCFFLFFRFFFFIDFFSIYPAWICHCLQTILLLHDRVWIWLFADNWQPLMFSKPTKRKTFFSKWQTDDIIVMETICIKCLILLSGKNKKISSICSLLN